MQPGTLTAHVAVSAIASLPPHHACACSLLQLCCKAVATRTTPAALMISHACGRALMLAAATLHTICLTQLLLWRRMDTSVTVLLERLVQTVLEAAYRPDFKLLFVSSPAEFLPAVQRNFPQIVAGS